MAAKEPQTAYSGKYCGAVIVAAGSASRMEGIDKALALLGGEPVIVQTVKAFQNCPAIEEIVIVTRQDLLEKIADLAAPYAKVKAIVVGGADRTQSVLCGLQALSEKVELAAIHDGARPLITPELIVKTVSAADFHGAAAPAIAVKDTIKNVQNHWVYGTPDRSSLRAVQTPQVFCLPDLLTALTQAIKDGAAITDDCSALERMGIPVYLVDGQESNMKITTPMDLKVAQMLWEERQ
jgi:2-C-methyl-D-erythritol 4-phosphate cytidylyltransferase